MGFERISILGVGLMGGSLGLACRSLPGVPKITGFSHRPDELQRAVARGAIDYSSTDAVDAVKDADLVILCTPIGVFWGLIELIAPGLKQGAIVTDVGSTKRGVHAAAEKILKSATFVGSHPMAGGEKHGIENARADLLEDSLCIITPGDPRSTDQVEQFWKDLKMRTVRMSPEQHDRLTADISHIPHAMAAALVRMQSNEALEIAGRGFIDTTRIAAGDSAVWRDILLENRDNVRTGLQRLQDEIGQLLEKLDGNDSIAVQQWLKVAAKKRSEMET